MNLDAQFTVYQILFSILSVGSKSIFQSMKEPKVWHAVHILPMYTHLALPFSRRVKPTLIL